ncbi:MAG: hypothetical protein Q4B68_04645 [Bacteroidales bacterium]|nr:hypothetical protein [Bacteroidales bacterium]
MIPTPFMGRLRRYRTAWSRHHRSGGFGIHSPFAFYFVQRVLGEKCPYYAYAHIELLRIRLKDQAGRRWRGQHIISLKMAKMLFRIANYFNPARMLIIGERHAVATASVMAVSSKSRVVLHAPEWEADELLRTTLQPHEGRIHVSSDLSECLKAYSSQISPQEKPFVLIHELCDEMELEAVKSAIFPIIERQGVVIMRNLHNSTLMASLWEQCMAHAQHGQTYTNEKSGIIVANPKLQREHFFLWF